MLAKIISIFLLLCLNHHMYTMFTLATKSFKIPGSIVFRALLFEGPIQKDLMKRKYNILDQKVVTEFKKLANIKEYNILDQNFKKDFKIKIKDFVMCNPRNFAAMVYFCSITAETALIWDTPIIPCLSGLAFFSVYSAQKLSCITEREPLNKASIRLAGASNMNNFCAGGMYSLYFIGQLANCNAVPITQFEAALHIFLLWNFYKNIMISEKILPDKKDCGDDTCSKKC